MIVVGCVYGNELMTTAIVYNESQMMLSFSM